MYPTRVIAFLLVITGISLNQSVVAKEPSAEDLIKKVVQAYESLKTYQAKGVVVANMDTGQSKIEQRTTFSIRLKKPNSFRITWETTGGPMAQSGAVWREGGAPYLYMSALNAYAKMTSDEIALGGATGISAGAAFTIPSLFLSVSDSQASAFSRLEAPSLEESESIDGDECYVLSGASVISKKETYWISKEKSLIRKYQRSLETPDVPAPVAEMTEEQIEAALKSLGEEVNAETKAKMKQRMAGIKQMMSQIKLKGTSTESQNDIATPEFEEIDFKYTPPANAEQKESLFGSFLKTR